MEKYKFFWNSIKLCDWGHEGDDDLVLQPVIQYLASKDDSDIFEFDNQMSELLFALDTKKLVNQYKKKHSYLSDDGFLYSRCVALINGATYYEEALLGKHKEIWDMEFESLLYVPQKAWALKHQKEEDDYPHISPVSYETGSNYDSEKNKVNLQDNINKSNEMKEGITSNKQFSKGDVIMTNPEPGYYGIAVVLNDAASIELSPGRYSSPMNHIAITPLIFTRPITIDDLDKTELKAMTFKHYWNRTDNEGNPILFGEILCIYIYTNRNKVNLPIIGKIDPSSIYEEPLLWDPHPDRFHLCGDVNTFLGREAYIQFCRDNNKEL